MWTTAPVPRTAMQRSNFLDLCTQWLVHSPPSVDDLPASLERTAPATAAGVVHGFAYTPVELRAATHRRWACSLCEGEETVVPLVANPYVQRCTVLVCAGCGDVSVPPPPG